MASVRPTQFPAFAIEGIGDEPGNASVENGWLIVGQGARPHLQTIRDRTTWEPKPWIVEGSVSLNRSELELFQSGVTWPTFSCELTAVDEAAERFVNTQFFAQATLENRVTPSDTTIDLSRSDLADSIIYIGNETIRLQSKVSTSGGVTTYNHISDQYRSLARAHEAEAPVFTEVPFLDARRVQLFAVYVEAAGSDSASDPELDIVQRGQMQLVGNMAQSQGRLQVKTRSAGQRLQEIKGGKGDRLVSGDFPIKARTFSSDDQQALRIFGAPRQSGSSILKPEALSGDTSDASAVQIEDYAFPAEVQVDTSPTPNEGTGIQAAGQALWDESPSLDDLGIDGEDADSGTVDKEAYEVFAADRDAGVTPLQPVADALSIDGVEWHRLSYFAAIALSTNSTEANASEFDVLQPEWSVNAEWAFTDSIVSDIKTLIRNVDAKVDRIALGSNNDAVELWDFCVNELLKPMFTLRLTSEGELTVGRVRSPTISDHDDALGRPVKPRPSEVLEQDPARDRTKYGAQVTVGKTELTEGRSLQIRNDANLNQRWLDYENSRGLSINWSVVRPERAINPGTGDDESGGTVSAFMKDNLQIQSFPNPRLTFLTDDNRSLAADYELGEFINLSNFDLEPEWVVDADSTRVNNFTDVRATGVVVGRQFFFETEDRSSAYVLTVMFVSDGITRWRAPSGKIQAVNEPGNGTTELTLEADDGSASHYGATDDSGNAVADAQFFTSGDEVEIRNPDFTEWADNKITTVSDVSGRVVTVDDTYASTPPTGRFVELAHLDSDDSGTGYVNAGIFDNVSRAYIYLAESDGTLGSANLDPDQYGA